MEKAAIFIDGGYLDSVLLNFGRVRIDYNEIANEMCQGCIRFRTYYYHCMPYQSNTPSGEEKERYSNMRRFITKLERLPRFEVRLGKVVKYGDEAPHQKQVDTLLGVDVVKLSAKGHINKAILLAGDADHVPAVKVAKEEGVIIELYYLPRTKDGSYTVSGELFDLCDERVPITLEFLEKFKR